MNQFNPLVSIVIPVYNGANYLREAIDSALAQTYKNIEILVINDGSTDDGATRAIALSYGDKIRYYEKDNGGVVSALNFGIDHMSGEYFAWLSHDDLYLPRKIEKQVNALLANYNTDHLSICVCNGTIIDKSGKTMYLYDNQANSFDIYPQCDLLFGQGFSGIMVLIPKVLFGICGQFHPSLATHEYDMWLRLMRVANIVVVPDHLVLQRYHSEQITMQRKDEITKETDRFLGCAINEISTTDVEAYFQESGRYILMDIIMTYFSQQYYYACFILMHKTRTLLLNNQHGVCNTTNLSDFPEDFPQFTLAEILEFMSHWFNRVKEIGDMYELATSWRLTKPIRYLGRFVRAVKKYGISGIIKKAFHTG